MRILNTPEDWDEALRAISEAGDVLVVRSLATLRVWTAWEDDRGEVWAWSVPDEDGEHQWCWHSDREYDRPPSAACAVLWWPGEVLVPERAA